MFVQLSVLELYHDLNVMYLVTTCEYSKQQEVQSVTDLHATQESETELLKI